MARTIETVVEEINKEANRYSALSDLQTNTSRVSVWDFVKRSLAFAVVTLEKMVDKHREEVQDLVDQQEAGSLRWYAKKARDFQYGDRVSIVDNKVKYTVEDESKKIVRHVSINEGTAEDTRGTLYIKALKEGDNTLVPLTVEEKNAMLAYMNSIKFAGIKIEIVSTHPDLIKLSLQVEVNDELIDRNGYSTADPSVSPVQEAIKKYFNNLPFDGVFYLSKLEDQIQAVGGVIDVNIVAAHQKSGDSNYEVITRKHESKAGYLSLDEDGTAISYLGRT